MFHVVIYMYMDFLKIILSYELLILRCNSKHFHSSLAYGSNQFWVLWKSLAKPSIIRIFIDKLTHTQHPDMQEQVLNVVFHNLSHK